MKIEFTEEEGNALINILDVAIKAKGLELASTCDYFFNKLKQAYASEKEKKEAVKIAEEV